MINKYLAFDQCKDGLASCIALQEFEGNEMFEDNFEVNNFYKFNLLPILGFCVSTQKTFYSCHVLSSNSNKYLYFC